METWYWQTWEGLPYLKCALLQSWPHGFFTQQFWPKTPSELGTILQPEVPNYRVKQVHGNTILSAGEVAGSVESVAADALVTEQAEQAVWVCSADCTPVLIGDIQTGQVAAIHAGWRGTAAKIVPLTIARLQTQGSQLSDLRIALGPAITGAVYQVHTQVAAEIGATVVTGETPAAVIAKLLALPQSPLSPDPEPERVRLDVRRVIALQLEQLGISAEQMTIAPYCTYQQPEYFFSYRRDHRKQVQWSGIVSHAAQTGA